MNINDLLMISQESVEWERDYQKLLNETDESWAKWTDDVHSFGLGVESFASEINTESAIGGNNILNRLGYYFAKMPNIFTKRQSGFNNVINQMQRIDISKISQAPANISLTPEVAQNWARVTNAFNPQAGNPRTAEFERLMNEMDLSMSDARWEPLRLYWERLKSYVLSVASFATIILFPLGIYYLVLCLWEEIKFYVSLWKLAVDQAEKDTVMAKGMNIMSVVVLELIDYVYRTACPGNPAKIGAKMTHTDLSRVVSCIVAELNGLKVSLNRKAMVTYDEKVKAAQAVYEAAAKVYKEKLHMVSPGAMKVILAGSKAFDSKMFAAVEGYTQWRQSVDAIRGLMTASDLYFDCSNRVLTNLYKM